MAGEFLLIKQKISSIVKSHFSEANERILDLGCGEKPFYHKAIKGKIYCYDIKKTKKSHVVGHAQKLPFKNNVFDSVISINSLYYFENPFAAMEEAARVLKKNGRLFLITPFIYPIHDAPHDKYRFTEYGLRTIVEENFKIKELKPIGGIFNLPAVVLHSLIKGIKFMIPNSLRHLTILSTIVLYPFYLVAQVLSILDFIDVTKRWPTYYFVLAVKK